MAQYQTPILNFCFNFGLCASILRLLFGTRLSVARPFVRWAQGQKVPCFEQNAALYGCLTASQKKYPVLNKTGHFMDASQNQLRFVLTCGYTTKLLSQILAPNEKSVKKIPARSAVREVHSTYLHAIIPQSFFLKDLHQ